MARVSYDSCGVVVGSPVGLFMLLKGDKLRSRLLEMAQEEGDLVVDEDGALRPEVNAIYNIFHPHGKDRLLNFVINDFQRRIRSCRLPHRTNHQEGTCINETSADSIYQRRIEGS